MAALKSAVSAPAISLRLLTCTLLLGLLQACSNPNTLSSSASTPSVAPVLYSELQYWPSQEAMADDGLSCLPESRIDLSSGAVEVFEAAHEDVWARIRSGYSMQGDVDERRIDRQMDVYGNPQRFFDHIGPQASWYIHYVVGELEQRNMPLELALLPIVESGYNPRAVSPGNAAGLWQITPGTGTRLGLHQNSWYDGRKDVVASTEAALDYLEELHKRFDGDWYLALAAYNAGEGNVQRAIDRNRRLGKPTDYWSLPLSRQACNYVPRLLALSRILEEPADHDVELTPIPNAPSVVPVKVSTQINLKSAVTLAGIDSAEFFSLNPAYKNGYTPPGTTTRLLVPADDKQDFLDALARMPRGSAITAHGSSYRIRPGDNLVAIARLYQTTPEALRALNGLTDNAIRAGDTLRIPQDAVVPERQYPSSHSVRLKKHGIYVVQGGDSLWLIAKRFGTSTRQLAQMNAIGEKSALKIGQELRVSPERGVSLAKVATSAATATGKHKIDYKVKRGDSLYDIADRFKVAVREVMRWNDIDSGRPVIYPGQSLVLYVEKPVPT